MLDPKYRLTIKFDDNSSFTDYSMQAFDYGRDTFQITMVAAEDYLYIGYEKPFHCVYVDLTTANTNANTFTAQFYNGTTWVNLDGFYDETKGFTRSAFIRWNKNQTNQAATTINSLSKFYVRLRPSVDHSATTISGISVVFSDDQDLKQEFFQIDRFLPTGQATHILHHVAARDEIIQKLKNDGRAKVNLSSGEYKDLDMWDILEHEQIRNASKYLTLSKIFFNRSDAPDDIYMNRSEKFRSLFNKAIDLFFLDLDQDDDGLKDPEEQLTSATMSLYRR